jgi:hypothetical protein
MCVVFTKTSTTSAYATVWAVIDLLAWIVVPQLAYVAVVAGRLYTTFFASVRCFLRGATGHAEHVLRGFSIQRVVLDLIMAVPASVPVAAIIALDFDVAPVVFAAEHKFFFHLVLLIVVLVVLD